MNVSSSFKQLSMVCLVLGLAIASGAVARAQQAKRAQVRATGAAMSVKGYVIDSACTFTKSLKKPISSECAIACAKAGSPLVIQTESGTIYWPISGDTPATGENDKLLPYAGKLVSARGKIYSKGGSNAIVIEKIAAAD